MKEKIAFYNQIDYTFEAYQLLCCLADEQSGRYGELKKSVMQKYGEDSLHVKNCVRLEERILEGARTFFSDRMEQIRNLYGVIAEQTIPADLVLGWRNMMDTELTLQGDTSGIRKYFQEMSPAERDADFFKNLVHEMEQEEFDRLVGCEMRGSIVPEAERIRNILTYIQRMEIPLSGKMSLFDLYLNRDVYFEQMTELIDAAIVYLRKYDNEIKKLCGEWGRYWEKIVEEGEVLSLLSGVLDLKQDAVEKEMCLMPSVVQCAAIWLEVDDGLVPDHRGYRTTCRLGVMLMEEFDWNSHRKEEYDLDEAVPVLKALGDRSKADILLFIKDKPAYGSEIAKQFSLTTATVSHHMNKLLQLQLVQAELRDGRVYYQTRKKTVQELFENCIHLFT